MSGARARWRIVPFDTKVHDRSSFSCGATELDHYIREFASQDSRRDVARVFVAVEAGADVVASYYSLSAASFRRESLSAAEAKRLPRYPVPAVLLGRLAVDERRKGRGLGATLLMDALNRACLASEVLGLQALIVEAHDNAAAAFYRKFGFLRFADDKERLFLPLVTIRRMTVR